MDPIRPLVPDTTGQKIGRFFAGVTPARIVTMAAALLTMSLGAWWLLRAPAPPVERSLPFTAKSGTPVTGAPPPSLAPAEVVVQIAGAVARPGVYRLSAGSRVADLVEAAGGAVDGADASSLTLATKLADGQRVVLARPGDPVSAAAAAAQVTADPIVDLNTATAAQLDALPGIGPATAAAIVAYRDSHGPFQSVDDLLRIKGLGASKVDALKGLVRV